MLFYLAVSSLLVANAFGATTCPVEYTHEIREKCYKLVIVVASHTDAKSKCTEINGRLVVFDNADQLAEVYGAFSPSQMWIGAYFDASHADWMDGNGQIATYTPWGKDYPSTSDPSQCVYMSSVNWKNEDCAVVKPYLCQREKPEPTCEPGWKKMGDLDQCVKVFKRVRKTFDDARADCKEKHGDLATSVIERNHRKIAMARINFRAHFWIGYLDENKNGSFLDINGVLKENQPFQKGRPSTKELNDKHCVTMKRRRWFDKRCNRKHFYICQKVIG